MNQTNFTGLPRQFRASRQPATRAPPKGDQMLDRRHYVPTFQEVGIGALNQSGWGGVFVPSTTPRSIIDILSAESMRIGTSPELVERTHAAGYTVHVLAAREFSQFFGAEREYWARTFRQFGIKAE